MKKAKEWNPTLTQFQADFFTSKALFPDFVADWGTFKTMIGIL